MEGHVTTLSISKGPIDEDMKYQVSKKNGIATYLIAKEFAVKTMGF